MTHDGRQDHALTTVRWIERRFATRRGRAWVAVWGDHDLRVVTSGWFGARLFVDGALLDARNTLLSFGGVPALSAFVSSSDSEVLVAEVRLRGILDRRPTLRIAGQDVPLTEVDPDESPATDS